MAASPVIGRRRGAFSTLLRRPGLRASSDGVLATKSERKMLASTCLYSLYARFCWYKFNTRRSDYIFTRLGTRRTCYTVPLRHTNPRNFYPPAQHSGARWMFSAASVCLSVCACLFVSMITSERLNTGRSNLAVRYAVQESRPSSKVKVKSQRSRSPGTKKRKKTAQSSH